MTPKQATEAVKLAEDYDVSEANSLMDAWLAANQEMLMQADIPEHWHDNFDHLHAKIAALYEERRRQLYPPMSVIEAIQHYNKNSGYGDRQREAIGAARIEDFEQLIKNMPPEDQRELFRFFEPIANNRRVGTDFGPAADKFFQAVSNVIKREPESRAANVWLRALKEKKMEGVLDKIPPAEPTLA